MSAKYALIIGNSEYLDPGLAQLAAPGRDAEEFARVLQDQSLCAFDQVKVLVNQLSTTVIEAVDEFFDQKKPNDLLVLYFSGHGMRDEFGSLYLAFKNTNRSRLRSTAIKDDYIRGAMDQSRSKRQVVILDCCNSGAFPQGTKAATGGVMGLTQAFQGYGRFVLTASDATQYAWEGDKVIGNTDNSLFTHFLVKGLEGDADSDGDGKITVDELYEYAYEAISKVTASQTPTKSASKVEGEIVLRQITRLEDIKPAALPDDLLAEIDDLRPYVREHAVQRLDKIVRGQHIGLARSAAAALEKIAADENTTRRVAEAAAQALASWRQAEAAALPAAEAKPPAAQTDGAEQMRRQAAERLAAEEQRRAQQAADEQRQAKQAAEQLARQRMETEQRAKQAEAARRARLEAERQAQEKIEAEKKLAAAAADVPAPRVTSARPAALPEKSPAAPARPRRQLWVPLLIIGALGVCVLGSAAFGFWYVTGPGRGLWLSAAASATSPQATELPAVVPTGLATEAASSAATEAATAVATEAAASVETPATATAFPANGAATEAPGAATEAPVATPAPNLSVTPRPLEHLSPYADSVIAWSCHNDICLDSLSGELLKTLPLGLPYGTEWVGWAPNGAYLVFGSNQAGVNAFESSELYSLDIRSGQLLQLTNSTGGDMFPVWSPDSSQIAFVSERNGSRNPFVMNADGSGQFQLSDRSTQDLFWTPDGLIGFGTSDGLFVINPDGTNERQLTTDDIVGPSWAPDNQRFAYLRNCQTACEARVAEADGSGGRSILTDPQYPAYYWSTYWSPDARSLAVQAQLSGNNYEIIVINMDTGIEINVTNFSGSDLLLGWLPREARVVFLSSRSPAGVYTVRPDGTDAKFLAAFTQVEFGQISP